MTNMPPDGFANTSGPPDGFADETVPEQPSFLDKAKSAYSKYQQSPVYQASPVGLLNKANDLVRQGANKVGEKATEMIGGSQNFPSILKPYQNQIAAGVGTAIQMAPDIATSFAGGATGEAEKGGSQVAQDYALRAMNAPKRMFKSPQMVAKARGSAQTLLDQGAISGSAEGMAGKLGDLESSSGQAIGDILGKFKDQGKFYNLQDGINEMEGLRPRSASGQVLQGGQYDAINSKIDNAINTVKAHMPAQQPKGILGGNTPQPNPTINFDEANQLKGKLQDAANYNSNKDATLLDKVIAGKFRESLDNSLGKAANDIQDPQLAQEFQKQKQIYGSTQFGKDAVYNKLASELANKKISLTDWILGSHGLISGNPLTAVAEVGGKKLLEKYGPSITANTANTLSKSPGLVNSAAATAANVTQQLTREKAKEFLQQANGDKDKARDLATQAGYSF